MALDRSTVLRPVLRKEAVPVETLGGEVIVRQLTLTEMLTLGRDRPDDEVAQVLAWCCIDPQGKPLLDLEEWQAWGASCPGDAVRLYETAIRLTGHAEKKTT
jgi:hypothetical protein